MNKFRFVILLVSAVILPPGVANAQSTVTERSTAPTQAAAENKEEVIQLSPFVVSDADDEGYRAQQTMVGSRTATNLMELPVSVGIINLQQLEDSSAVDVHEVLKYGASGVTQNQQFNNDVNIRGFRLGGTLRNGNLARAGNKHYPFYDIERVEVLKGPAAMLNGSNGGIGGTLNYFTRRPTETPQGEVKVSVNSTGRLRGQINSSGPVLKRDGFRMNYRATIGVAKSDAPHGKDIEWEDQRYYSAALAMYFGSDTTITIEGSFDDNRTYLYLTDFLDITVPVNPVTGLFDARLNQYSTESYSMARQEDAFWPLQYTDISTTFLHRLTDNAHLRAVYNYTRLHDIRRNNRGIDVRANNFTLARQDIRNNNGHTAHSFQLDFQHSLPLKWVKIDTMLGADGSSVESWQDQSILNMPDVDSRTGLFPDDAAFFAQYPTDFDIYFRPRPASAGPPATRTRSINRALSYYFQENVSFWNDRVILTGGLRWFKPHSTSRNMVTNVLTEGDSRKFRVHKYGIVVKVLPSVSVYYTDAQNVFLAPDGRTDRVIQGDMLGDPFQDSEGQLTEFGVKFDYKVSDRLTAYGSAAHFKMQQTNIRTFGILPSGNQGLIQSAQDSAKGWEADLGLRLKTDSGAADVIFTAFDGDSAIADDAGKAYVRQTNAFVPWKYSLYGRYSWSTGALRRLRIGGGVEIEDDKRYGGHMLEHPLLADAFAGYGINDHWDVQLNLSNLTNERYIVQVAARGLVQTNDLFRAKLTVGYSW